MGRPTKFDDGEILNRASDLLWREGCDAVTIRDLEVVLDLKAPSIYRRFGSRDALIARSVDHYVDRVIGGRVRRFLDTADDPIEGLHRFFTSVLEPMPGESFPRGCLLTVTAGQASFADETIRTSVTEGFVVIETAFRRTLGRARDRGELAAEVDLDLLAASLLVSFEGLLVLARSGHTGLADAVHQLLSALLPAPDQR